MKKIIFIGTQPEYKTAAAKVFCKIEFKDKKLLISGVVGPTRGGDALGSCGQIYDSIEVDNFQPGWDKDTLAKFIAIWREWHLNDMNACTLEMKAAGWDKLASKEIFKYSYIISNEASDRRKQLQNDVVKAAIEGIKFELSEDEKRLLLSDTGRDIHAYSLPETPEFMEPWADYTSKKHKIERKTLGWVNEKEHPDGLLGKKLNGFGYGCAWYFHEVPQEAIDFLQSLPEATEKPNWI